MRLFCSMPARACFRVGAQQPQRMARPMALQNNIFGAQLQRTRFSTPGLFFNPQMPAKRRQSSLIVEANNKRCLGDTTYGTRRTRTRTSGFRARKLTVGGRKVLQSRRKKGRKVLCPANSNRGKKATARGNRK